MPERKARLPLDEIDEELKRSELRLKALRALQKRLVESDEYRARCEQYEETIRELGQKYETAMKELESLKRRLAEVEREREEYAALAERLTRDIKEYNKLIDQLTAR
ncbi:MAG: hypothetical protein QXH26_05035 [Candidatus Hadarchaeales archaeon]